MSDQTKDALRSAALKYHETPKPGKLEVRATKPLASKALRARHATRHAVIWSPWCQTDQLFWDWAILGHWHPNP